MRVSENARSRRLDNNQSTILWDATGWHRHYSSPAWRKRATEEQNRIGWEIAVRIEKILCTVLHEAHERQVEETTETLGRGPEGFKIPLG